ncbi:signal transduction histidine kinase [Pseudochelatococcus lubricantis]|uniref:histidine kinase n=1 Tax=Pseudochelatococcus lubricantis TaxID=1538102 RepID=A0ABX0V3L5_9HYPH|nr:HAMP domain-containing sensor histidine kinase [Pseudochelatococcus lubricantis]NIJ59809.1 signal transduction histidine kinase [Pseudochelatococcus lubricantis]
MRGSLFLKIYLTLLASLVVVALAGAAFLQASRDDEDRGFYGRRDAMLSALLPADADPAKTRFVLERLAEAFDADIAVYEPDGRLSMAAGNPLPPAPPGDARRHQHGNPWRNFSVRLPDGRVVAGHFGAPPGFLPSSPLILLALVAGATGLAAWPAVRGLTRRLERLRRGVEEWGEGDLTRRVPVQGRDEVAALAGSFNLAAEKIEKLVEAHRILLANASHELRSPLARLRMALDLYEAAPSSERKREIVRNLSELDALVDEILLASRLDHGDPSGLLSESVDLLALAAEEGARQNVAVSGEPATVTGDHRLLSRLVRNLVQNAIRHGGPPVIVEVRRRKGMVELGVRDHGPGIPEAERERIFEPFYRPAGHGEAAGGWGIGLALVRKIADRHGASVRLETPDDGGTRIVVTFPVERTA